MSFLAFLKAKRLASQLMDDESSSVGEARDRIKKLGAGAASVPEILAAKFAETCDLPKKARAIQALQIVVSHVKGDPKKVVPALTSALEHASQDVQKSAARALKEYGAAAQEAVPALIKRLSRPEAAKHAAEALSSITNLDQLPEEARFRAYVVIGRSAWHAEAWDRAVKMGPRFLPLLEEMLLSAEPSEHAAGYGQYDSGGPQVFMSAICIYDKLGGVPSGKLRDKLIHWALDKDLRTTPDESDAKEIAKQILQRGAGIGLDDHIAWIRGASRSLQSQAIWACRAQPPTERRDEIVAALIPAAQTPGRNQVEAIECLGRFHSDARVALPVLESLIAAAKRPATRDDFKEQEQVLGGLTQGIVDRIVSRSPIDQEVLAAAVEAIRRISGE